MRICIIWIIRKRLQSTCVALMEFGENYFGGEPIRRMEGEVRVGKHKNGKAAGKDEVTRDKR